MADSETSHSRRNIRPFDGARFTVWKHRVFALLDEKEVLEVIEGDPPAEITDDWKKKERIARSIIIENLKDTMLIHAPRSDSPKKIIANLSGTYERVCWTTQATCETKLLNLKFKEDIPLATYFAQFDEIIIELKGAGGELSDKAALVRLVLGLPPSYNPVKAALRAISDDTLTVAVVKQKLLEHEAELVLERGDVSKKALHVESTNTSNGNGRGGGHIGRGGFNSRYNRRGRGGRIHTGRGRGVPRGGFNGFSNRGELTCHNCGRAGHFKRDCYSYRRGSFNRQNNYQQNNNQQNNQQNNNQQNNNQQGTREVNNAILMEDNESVGQSGNEDSQLFMAGQHDIPSTYTNEELVFLLDSGATDHIVNDKKFFASMEQLPQPIHLSIAKKDASVTATMRGSINVTTDLGIEGV